MKVVCKLNRHTLLCKQRLIFYSMSKRKQPLHKHQEYLKLDSNINKLFYGDNLDILKQHIPSESVDLIYLDPPFNSNAEYNILFKEPSGEQSTAQIQAFSDFWRWDYAARESYEYLTGNQVDNKIANLAEAFYKLLGKNDMNAYLFMMTRRLIELHRVLKPTGLLFLHCDPTASHYLKLVLDTIFGQKNFRNEIIWCYSGGGIPKRDFPRKHDVIFRYSKSDDYFYTPDFKEYSKGTIQRGRTQVKGKYFEAGLRAEGTPVTDWWTDIKYLHSPTDSERLGYPTQKSVALLKRIISTSTKKGDWVLDPFCGCGTAVVAAEDLERKWIGIDITWLAINLVKNRMRSMFPHSNFVLEGEPKDLGGAKDLAKNPYQFQWWALSLIGARPVGSKPNNPREGKKGADEGVDGWLRFRIGEEIESIVVQVKSGHVSVKDIRELRDTVPRQGAVMGILLTLENPTNEMIKEVKATDPYVIKSLHQTYPKIQILTIEQLLHGIKPDMPQTASAFQQAMLVSRTSNKTVSTLDGFSSDV